VAGAAGASSRFVSSGAAEEDADVITFFSTNGASINLMKSL
jgi:hypothetical protein